MQNNLVFLDLLVDITPVAGCNFPRRVSSSSEELPDLTHTQEEQPALAEPGSQARSVSLIYLPKNIFSVYYKNISRLSKNILTFCCQIQKKYFPRISTKSSIWRKNISSELRMLGPLACLLVVLLAPPSLGLPAYLVRPLPSREELRLRPSGRPFTISVEGNVGAGKSTLLKYFQKVSS